MTLQELHELTGKVLQERPELASATIKDYTYGESPKVAYYDTNIHRNQVVILTHPARVELDTEILVWQAN